MVTRAIQFAPSRTYVCILCTFVNVVVSARMPSRDVSRAGGRLAPAHSHAARPQRRSYALVTRRQLVSFVRYQRHTLLPVHGGVAAGTARMTRASASAALHSLPGDCAARDAAHDALTCDASALLSALRGADAPLPAALAWLRARARAGALAVLPAALAARDLVPQPAAAAAPPPRGRLRLGALPPPAPAAILHALRLEARLCAAQRRACLERPR